MGRIDRLAERYKSYIALPWQKDLAGAQRAIFVVYDKTDERRLRTRKDLFAMATTEAGHRWLECDLTRVFAEWMSSTEYRESYFESPKENAVVGIYGIASLFGFLRVSKLMKEIEGDIRGRVVVFFPGEYENSNYRLMDARDGWNYLAVPITLHEERGVYEV